MEGRGAGGGRQVLVVLAVLLGALAGAQHAYSRRADMSPAPFTFAARYGRSPHSPHTERLITPRNNRWLLTARYGKRSESFTLEENSSTQQVQPPPDTGDPPAGAGVAERGGVSRALSCVYTGVLALYHCTRTPPPARRSEEVASMLPREED